MAVLNTQPSTTIQMAMTLTIRQQQQQQPCIRRAALELIGPLTLRHRIHRLNHLRQ